MKVLILSVTAGQGHNAIANALTDAFRSKGVEASVLDVFEYISPFLKDAVNHGYLLSAKVAPKSYGRAYEQFNKDKPSKKGSLSWLANQIMMRELADFVTEFSPDIIACTHSFASFTLDALVQAGFTHGALTVGIVPDFTIHPFWEESSHLDYYVTASDLLALQMKKKGLDPAKMLPLGIPVQEKFSTKIPKEEARKQLSLDPNKRTLLIMSGSMGFGKMDKSIKQLDKLEMDFQAMVVCGNNHQMEEKLKKMKLTKDFHIFGYVSNVDLMMDAADCIITKPGGITTSETLTKELPMIMVNHIPGQEGRNVEFLLNNHLAINTSKTFPLEEAVYTLFHNPTLLENLQKNAKAFMKKQSAMRTVEALMDAVNR